MKKSLLKNSIKLLVPIITIGLLSSVLTATLKSDFHFQEDNSNMITENIEDNKIDPKIQATINNLSDYKLKFSICFIELLIDTYTSNQPNLSNKSFYCGLFRNINDKNYLMDISYNGSFKSYKASVKIDLINFMELNNDEKTSFFIKNLNIMHDYLNEINNIQMDSAKTSLANMLTMFDFSYNDIISIAVKSNGLDKTIDNLINQIEPILESVISPKKTYNNLNVSIEKSIDLPEKEYSFDNKEDSKIYEQMKTDCIDELAKTVPNIINSYEIQKQ